MMMMSECSYVGEYKDGLTTRLTLKSVYFYVANNSAKQKQHKSGRSSPFVMLRLLLAEMLCTERNVNYFRGYETA